MLGDKTQIIFKYIGICYIYYIYQTFVVACDKTQMQLKLINLYMISWREYVWLVTLNVFENIFSLVAAQTQRNKTIGVSNTVNISSRIKLDWWSILAVKTQNAVLLVIENTKKKLRYVGHNFIELIQIQII